MWINHIQSNLTHKTSFIYRQANDSDIIIYDNKNIKHITGCGSSPSWNLALPEEVQQIWDLHGESEHYQAIPLLAEDSTRTANAGSLIQHICDGPLLSPHSKHFLYNPLMTQTYMNAEWLSHTCNIFVQDNVIHNLIIITHLYIAVYKYIEDSGRIAHLPWTGRGSWHQIQSLIPEHNLLQSHPSWSTSRWRPAEEQDPRDSFVFIGIKLQVKCNHQVKGNIVSLHLKCMYIIWNITTF